MAPARGASSPGAYMGNPKKVLAEVTGGIPERKRHKSRRRTHRQKKKKGMRETNTSSIFWRTHPEKENGERRFLAAGEVSLNL